MTTPQRGSFLFTAAFAVGVVLNYAFNLIMARLLTVEDFGVLNYALSILGLGVLILSAGFPYVLIRRLGSGADPASVLRTCAWSNVAIAVTLAVALLGAQAAGLLELDADAWPLVGIVAITLLVNGLALVLRALLQARLKLNHVSFLIAFETFSKLAFGAALAFAGAGVAGAVSGLLVGAVAIIVVAAIAMPEMRLLTRGTMDPESLRMLLPMFAGLMSAHVLVSLDTLGLKLFAPDADADRYVGYYSAGMTIARVPLYLAGAVVGAIFPHLAQAREDVSVGALVGKMVKYTLVFLLPLTLAFTVAAEQIVLLFFPAPYAAGARAIAIAAVGVLLLALTLQFAAVFQAAVRPLVPATILGTGALLELALLAALTPEFGMIGTAVAMTATAALALGALVVAYRQVYGLRVPLAGAIKLAVAGAAFVAVLSLVPTRGPGQLIAALALATAVYGLLVARLDLISHADARILVSAAVPTEGKLGRAILRAFSWLRGKDAPHASDAAPRRL